MMNASQFYRWLILKTMTCKSMWYKCMETDIYTSLHYLPGLSVNLEISFELSCRQRDKRNVLIPNVLTPMYFNFWINSSKWLKMKKVINVCLIHILYSANTGYDYGDNSQIQSNTYIDSEYQSILPINASR